MAEVSKKAEYKFVEPQSKIYTFSEVLSEKRIVYQVVKMQDSLLVFVNDKDQMDCNNLALAMLSRFSDVPSCTTLMGNIMEQCGTNIARRLSKKLNKAVFLSFNVAEDRLLVPLVEKRLLQEIQRHPENF